MVVIATFAEKIPVIRTITFSLSFQDPFPLTLLKNSLPIGFGNKFYMYTVPLMFCFTLSEVRSFPEMVSNTFLLPKRKKITKRCNLSYQCDIRSDKRFY